MTGMRVLIVDDEKNIRRAMEMILKAEGYTVDQAANVAETRKYLESTIPEVVFLDVLLPDGNGLELLQEIKSRHPQVEVVMISGHANLQMAVQATRSGAYDFLEKPLQKDRILLLLQHLEEKQQLQKKFEELQRSRAGDYEMIGDSPVIQQVREQIQKVAPTNSKVLILGESGVGKELVAWAIHAQSSRRDGPFVKMNCAAIPEELIESELFGYEKGAFTGATETRDGKFLQADGGTLFLDEIADMSLSAQAKVLRVLQDGQFERVGGRTTLTVDVRVIAATNKNLEEEVQKGRFREDLYYRLNVFPIFVPPLRERKEDIPLLLNHFVQRYCLENNRRPLKIEPAVVEILQNYPWPGNIRELKNLAERLVILASGDVITTGDLPPHLATATFNLPQIPPGQKTLKEVREMAEREYILQCLKATGGNVSRAARLLGLERTNLHKKMKALGIQP